MTFTDEELALKRRESISELMTASALRWPAEVSIVMGVSEVTLRKFRADGDHPRLCGVGRALFTMPDDLREWARQHELAPGARVHPAGPGRPKTGGTPSEA